LGNTQSAWRKAEGGAGSFYQMDFNSVGAAFSFIIAHLSLRLYHYKLEMIVLVSFHLNPQSEIRNCKEYEDLKENRCLYSV
jgi:hypothetical protein